MDALLRTAWSQVKNGQPCLLAVVLDSRGSAPRGPGSMMLLLSDGTIRGSIGGGPMEWAVMREGASILAEKRPAQRMRYDLGGTDTDSADAICGGVVGLCLYPLGPDDAPLLEAACTRIEARENIGFGVWQEDGAMRLFCISCGQALVSGADDGPRDGLNRWIAEDGRPGESGVLYYSVITPRPRLWLMGGGHVALATAKVAQIAGFGIVVVDDRPEYANETRFPGARCIVCGRYDELPTGNVSPTDYIAILTRGHRHDRESLAWALRTAAGYVGMIGSRKKKALIYEALRAEGVPQERLDWVHAPIGLPIGDHTPGDIAVSIVAEIVAIRAERAGEHTPHRK